MPRKKGTSTPNAGKTPASGRKSGRISTVSDAMEVASGLPYPRQCQLCRRKVSGLEDCARHIAEAHAGQLKLCDMCSRGFIDEKEYEEHIAKHQSKSVSTVSCAHCSFNFTNTLLLEQHDFEKHEAVTPGIVLRRYIPFLSSELHMNFARFIHNENLARKYICRICYHTVDSRSDHIKHLRRCRPPGKKLVCDKCANVFKIKNAFVKHVKISAQCSDPDYCLSLLPPEIKKSKTKCKICSKYILVAEMKTHVATCEKYDCGKCGAVFPNLQEYNDHNSVAHNESLKVTTCPYCRMEFIRPSFLEKHVKQHEKYKCLECNKMFRTPKPLLQHIRTHKNVKPYKCVPCDATFKEGFEFKTHITQHADKGYINFDENCYIIFTLEPPKKVESNETQDQSTSSLEDSADVDKSVEQDSVEAGETSEQVNETKDAVDEIDITKNELASQGGDTELESESEVKRTANEHAEIAPQSEEEEAVKKPRVEKRTRRVTRAKRHFDESSDDEPLLVVRKRKKRLMRPRRRAQMISLTKRTYLCTICLQRTNNLDSYNRHITRHFKAGAKQCVQCAKILPNRQKLDEHVREAHANARPMNRLHRFLKERAMSKLEALKAFRRAQAPPRPVRVPTPVPPPEPFRMKMKRVAAPTYDIIANGEIRMTGAQVKITAHDGPIPKRKIGDMTARNYVENFLPEETHQEKPVQTGKVPPVKQLTTNKHLKIRSVRSVIAMKMFRVRSRKFRERPVEEKRAGIAKPKPFRCNRREKTDVNITLLENYEEPQPRLDYGTRIEVDPPEDVYDADYFETDDHNVAQIEVSSTPAEAEKPKKGRPKKSKGFVVEVSSGEPTTEEIESKLAEVCKKLELPVSQTDLHIGQLTTSAPYYQIVNVKQVIKRQQKETKEKALQKRFDQIKIGNTPMVPVNPLAHLMGGQKLLDAKPPVKSIHVTPL